MADQGTTDVQPEQELTEICEAGELPLCMDKDQTLVLYAAVQNAYSFAPMLSDETDPEQAEGVQRTAAVLKEIGKAMEDNLEEFGVDYREIQPTSEQVPGFVKRVVSWMGGGG